MNVSWESSRRHPLGTILGDEYEVLVESKRTLESEFKRQIDTIPTEAQRRAAAERIEALLVEKGFTPDDEGETQ